MNNKSLVVLGITGGIGSGKSVVSRILKLLGADIYECDERGRWLQDNDEVLKRKINEAVGTDVYHNGLLDRKKLASIVFEDRNLMRKVCDVVYPTVENDFRSFISDKKGVVAIESATLLDSGVAKGCIDKVCMVYAPEEVRIERVMKRNKMNRDEVVSRIKSQCDQESLRSQCDFVIINDEVTNITDQVCRMYNTLTDTVG